MNAHCRYRIWGGLAAGALWLGVAGCGSAVTPAPPRPGAPPDPKALASACGALTAELEQTLSAVNARLGRTLQGAHGDRGLTRVQGAFNALQAESALPGSICLDYSRARINREAYHAGAVCLSRRLDALRAMEQDFEDARHQDLDVRQLAWRLDAKIDWIRQTLACEAQAYTGTPRGSDRLQRDAIRLDGSALQMATALVCERRRGPEEAPEPLERCNGATLHDGDRFKVMVHTSDRAYLYFYLFNGSGQFQMFFPDLGVDNRTKAGGRYTLPNTSWMRLDDVSGVFERIVLVASRQPIKALEELRGVHLSPTPSGDFAPQARDVRGIIEPLITRGAKMEQGAPVQLGDASPPVVPVVVEDLQTVAVEYELYHAPRL